jgi:hypothetical protein
MRNASPRPGHGDQRLDPSLRARRTAQRRQRLYDDQLHALTTGPVGVASCTPIAAIPATATRRRPAAPTAPGDRCLHRAPPCRSGNSYTTTTCNTEHRATPSAFTCRGGSRQVGWQRPAPSPRVRRCLLHALRATSGNNWTTTTCPNVVGTLGRVGSRRWRTLRQPIRRRPHAGEHHRPTSQLVYRLWPTWQQLDDDVRANNTAWTRSPRTPAPRPPVTPAHDAVPDDPHRPAAVASCTAASAGNAYTARRARRPSSALTNVGTCTPRGRESATLRRDALPDLNGAPVAVSRPHAQRARRRGQA